jgi:isocitrate dehydrogenase (NAD+)
MEPLTDATVELVRMHGLALKGPTATPEGRGHRSVNVQLRERLKLFANVRPIVPLAGIHTRWSDTRFNITLVRENTEDLYVGEEMTSSEGNTAIAVSRITYAASARVMQYACTLAYARGLKKVTVLHKSNILKQSQGLWLRACREVAQKEGIEVEALITDAGFMKLLTDPDRFGVVVATNMTGDILSDALAPMVGGLGFAPGANVGTDCAVFEAVHGSAPDIAGKGIANPTALFLSACMLLEHVGAKEKRPEHVKVAGMIRTAIECTLAEGTHCTADLRKNVSVGTQEYTQRVVDFLKEQMAMRKVA